MGTMKGSSDSAKPFMCCLNMWVRGTSTNKVPCWRIRPVLQVVDSIPREYISVNFCIDALPASRVLIAFRFEKKLFHK